MKCDGKLFAARHILAHLAEAPARPLTSEELAVCFRTDPVVIRRALAGLREAGIVAISLREVYVALGERGALALGQEPAVPGCLIEATVARALDDFYTEAEALLLRRLGDISLADLSTDFHRRFVEQTGLSRLTDAAPA